MSTLALFEDAAAENFLPLSWTRPVWELRCGILTLRGAIEDAYGRPVGAFHVRPFLADVVRERAGLPVNAPSGTGMTLLLNGRLPATRALPRLLPMVGEPYRALAPDGSLLAVWAEGSVLDRAMADGGEAWPDALAALPVREVEWPLLQWPWQLIEQNSGRLAAQAEQWDLGRHETVVREWMHLLHPDRIFVHPEARVMPGVVLDATDGPIVIEAGALVMANAVIQGPCYVGRNSSIKIGAKIYHGTTIGPLCKVGGEVEESIFQGYSNKQHDGFLGHAYVGSWCNFGADTNNSDLKNNYGTVTVWTPSGWRDTGSLFVGLFMGDHSKTGINATLNTGTVVGVGCNLFGTGLPPKFVPSFSWGGAGGITEHRLEAALETAERVMARRGIELTGAERALLAHIFAQDAAERGGS